MLTPQETADARSQGWALCEVYDLKTARITRRILPSDGFAVPFNRVDLITTAVVNRAKQGEALALRALQLLVKGF